MQFSIIAKRKTGSLLAQNKKTSLSLSCRYNHSYKEVTDHSSVYFPVWSAASRIDFRTTMTGQHQNLSNPNPQHVSLSSWHWQRMTRVQDGSDELLEVAGAQARRSFF